MSLFRRMLVEEWRLHSELFGSGRFGAFPLAIATFAGVGTYALVATDTTLGAVAAGIHALVFFFGLQVGTIGLIGRDAMADVLGDITMLVFSARTLPLSMRRVLATFLVKDVLYYSAFFVTPVIVGFGAVAVAEGLSVGTVALAWATMTATFTLGAATSLGLSALVTRNRLFVLPIAILLVIAFLRPEIDPVALTPYAIYESPSIESAVVGLAAIPIFAVLGVALFVPAGDDEGGDAHRRSFEGPLLRLTPGPLARRPMLAVVRSSGSVSKVLFSMGVLFGVTALALSQVTAATGVEAHAGIAFGTLLGLGAFTTYSWVTMYDDPREHLRYPTTTVEVFAGTRRAFLVLSIGAGLVYLVLALLWYPPLEIAVGVAILPPVTVYVFGVSAYVTGLSPNELLFDTPLFVLFGAALAVVSLPLLVAALATSIAPLPIQAGAVAIALLAGLLGLWLSKRAGPRWQARLRE